VVKPHSPNQDYPATPLGHSVLLRIVSKQRRRHSLRTLMTATNKKGQPSCSAFTLVEIMIVVSLIGLLAAMAVPSFLRSRNAAHRSTCINNLKQIDSAIQQWATELRKPQSARVDFSDISPYLKGALVCPSGGTRFSDSYTISTVADLPVCQKDPQTHVWLSSAIDIARSGE